MLMSAPYSLFWLPRNVSTFPLVSKGWAVASRLSKNSSNRFTGKRADPVLNVLFRMKSAYPKPEAKCGFPEASRNTALVSPLGANAQGGTLDSEPVPPDAEPLAQPGPSPGAGIVVVVGGVPLVKPMLLAATAKALAVRMALGLFHFRYVNDGVAVHGPSCHFASASPPIAYESVPEVT